MLTRERQRRTLKETEIEALRVSAVKSHKKCKGKGFLVEMKKGSALVPIEVAVTCSCLKRFDLRARFILSEIPYRVIHNQQIYSRTVIDETTGESYSIRKTVVSPYIKAIRRVIRTPYGLVLLGKNGTGKTFISWKICYYAILNGFTAHYLELPAYLSLLRRGFDEKLDRLISEISSVDLLVIDEIGNESKRSDFTISEFKALLKKRVTLERPTILISNYGWTQFKEEYGISIYSVVEANNKILNFAKAPDVRKARGSAEKENFFKKLVG